MFISAEDYNIIMDGIDKIFRPVPENDLEEKQTPTEFIESLPVGREHLLVKQPRRNLIDISKGNKSKGYKIESDIDKFREGVKRSIYPRYTEIHTHPTSMSQGSFLENLSLLLHGLGVGSLKRWVEEMNALPSGLDLIGFLENRDVKTSFIAIRDSDTGEVRGYQVMRKTQNTPLVSLSFPRQSEKFKANLRVDADEYNDILKKVAKNGNLKEAEIAMDRLSQKYHFQHKTISTEGWKISADGNTFNPTG